ncbi:hypothetical protein N7462_005307 [Penicillium macrosclerotiorum]|uniref:uncharacterized protein n=1 Tax=Penicillium macrosclerotiorum TaxID=303699 RepID=UPI002546714B|nr:uncharacterized protein N7462_005303 [Penicillium macrosclerotiorum]XP_056934120.1 uncharacterized protein N7462_005307 [Penicillium macrosclerotiorum]KAJ5684900.1 hypothetical protein N7462_005303 [Penicillium macrosclerotiorum]KAJ5684904.1 hypothetical protein N7462_005307 [Penicillium macrosclerotiorum]
MSKVAYFVLPGTRYMWGGPCAVDFPLQSGPPSGARSVKKLDLAVVRPPQALSTGQPQPRQLVNPVGPFLRVDRDSLTAPSAAPTGESRRSSQLVSPMRALSPTRSASPRSRRSRPPTGESRGSRTAGRSPTDPSRPRQGHRIQLASP